MRPKLGRWNPPCGPALAGLGLLLLVHPRAALTDGPSRPLPAADTATLVLQNRPIFVYRRPLGSYSPAERAALARERLAKVLEGPATGDSVGAEHLIGAITVTATGTVVLVVGPV